MYKNIKAVHITENPIKLEVREYPMNPEEITHDVVYFRNGTMLFVVEGETIESTKVKLVNEVYKEMVRDRKSAERDYKLLVEQETALRNIICSEGLINENTELEGI
ncbi:MAG: hypothetical protein ACRCVJ_18660 [Clostridium sp.]|uniref:hypothetical protein n=1 Tax=Clostridium sp. TaxID=1506 RepID=UPI003F3DAA0A